MTSAPRQQFHTDSDRLSADLVHRGRIQSAMGKYQDARGPRMAAWKDWQGARQTAAETKWAAINDLGTHLWSLKNKPRRAGRRCIGAARASRRGR